MKKSVLLGVALIAGAAAARLALWYRTEQEIRLFDAQMKEMKEKERRQEREWDIAVQSGDPETHSGY